MGRGRRQMETLKYYATVCVDVIKKGGDSLLACPPFAKLPCSWNPEMRDASGGAEGEERQPGHPLGCAPMTLAAPDIA